MFFPPIEVKRVRLEEAGQADGTVTATWDGGVNSQAAATGNLIFGARWLCHNSLIIHDILESRHFLANSRTIWYHSL
jgi:hypothetical protein